MAFLFDGLLGPLDVRLDKKSTLKPSSMQPMPQLKLLPYILDLEGFEST